MDDYLLDFFYSKYSETQIRNFIEKYPEKLNSNFWGFCSSNQNLSEPFIRDFQNKLYWDWICFYQDLSEEFLIEFIGKVETIWLEENERIPEDVKQRIVDLKKVIDQ